VLPEVANEAYKLTYQLLMDKWHDGIDGRLKLLAQLTAGANGLSVRACIKKKAFKDATGDVTKLVEELVHCIFERARAMNDVFLEASTKKPWSHPPDTEARAALSCSLCNELCGDTPECELSRNWLCTNPKCQDDPMHVACSRTKVAVASLSCPPFVRCPICQQVWKTRTISDLLLDRFDPYWRLSPGTSHDDLINDM
jgi:hypothetical protein